MSRGGLRTLKVKEASIERSIGDFLFYSRFCFYKQNTRGFMKGKTYENERGQKVVIGEFRKDLNPYALTGLPDYVVVYRGFHCGLEVKTPDGTQQKNQKEFEMYLKKKGGAFYYLVRSVEDAQLAMTEFKGWVDRAWLKLEN